jgi:hypothetical protein
MRNFVECIRLLHKVKFPLGIQTKPEYGRRI